MLAAELSIQSGDDDLETATGSLYVIVLVLRDKLLGGSFLGRIVVLRECRRAYALLCRANEAENGSVVLGIAAAEAQDLVGERTRFSLEGKSVTAGRRGQK